MLTLSAESHQVDKEEKDGKIIRQERRYGRFLRRFEVGKTVSEDDISAKFETGVLTLRAPKVWEIAPESTRTPIQYNPSRKSGGGGKGGVVRVGTR